MMSEDYIFIGDGFLANLGVQPIFVPIVAGSRMLMLSRFRQYIHYVNKLAYVNVVDDRGLIFYRMFKDETIKIQSGVVKSVKISDLIAEAKKISGDVCSLLRSLQPVFYSYKDFSSNVEKTTYTLPIIVRYKNLWEHFSLAPIKLVKDEQAEYYVYGQGIGIIVIDRDVSPKRPYAKEILNKPTSVLLSEECGIDIESVQLKQQKEEKREAKMGSLTTLMDARR